MKVMQLTINYRPNIGGLETHMEDLVHELLRRGDEVTVLTYRPLATKAEWKIVEKDKNILILRIPWIRGFFYKLVDKPALEILYLFPLLFIVTPFIILYRRPQVIHAHGLIAGMSGFLWATLFNKQMVISTHATYQFTGKDMFSKLSKFIFSHSDNILCLSEASRREVVKLGIQGSKVSVFTNWINTDEFIYKSKNDVISYSHKPLLAVLFVGRLVQEKGVLRLIDAAQYLDEGIHITFAGNGTLDQVVQRACLEDSRLSFLGKIKNTDLPSVYSSADVSIIPSIHEEGFGRVALESLACGTPVVASERGGLKILINESIGYFTGTDPREIADTLNRIALNKTELLAKSRNARSLVIEKYGNSLSSQIFDIYLMHKNNRDHA